MASHQNKIQSPHYGLYALYDVVDLIPLLVHSILNNSFPAVYGICQVHAHLRNVCAWCCRCSEYSSPAQIYMTCSLTSFRSLLTNYLLRSLSQLPYKKQHHCWWLPVVLYFSCSGYHLIYCIFFIICFPHDCKINKGRIFIHCCVPST